MLIVQSSYVTLDIFKKYMILLILEGEGEREREKHWLTASSMAPTGDRVPNPGTEPPTGACDLTGNKNGNLLEHGMMPNKLNHTGRAMLDILNTLDNNEISVQIQCI